MSRPAFSARLDLFQISAIGAIAGNLGKERRTWRVTLESSNISTWPAARAHRHQPVLAALPAAGQLGLPGAGQEMAQGVDRGDGARRQDRRANHLSRRVSQHAGARSAPYRAERQGGARLRPRGGDVGAHALSGGGYPAGRSALSPPAPAPSAPAGASSPHRRPARTLAPLEDRQGQAQARHRPHPRGARGPGRLPDRHRAGLRYRRGRDGAVVAARRAPVTMLAWESFGEGWVTDVVQAAQAQGRRPCSRPLRRIARSRQGRSRQRRGVHLERHHLGRARAERRLDRRRPRGPHHLRRDLGLFAQALDWPSSMSSPSPGRRRWAARRRTAC